MEHEIKVMPPPDATDLQTTPVPRWSRFVREIVWLYAHRKRNKTTIIVLFGVYR
jgi:hypothetical protein